MKVEFAKQKTSPDGNWIWNGKEWVTHYPQFQGRWIKTRADWDWLQNNPVFLRLMKAGIK